MPPDRSPACAYDPTNAVPDGATRPSDSIPTLDRITHSTSAMQNPRFSSLFRLVLASLLLLSLGAIATVEAQAPASDSSMEGGAESLRSALDSDRQLEGTSLSRGPDMKMQGPRPFIGGLGSDDDEDD